jgi:DNA invertase Pin-like site-specific DNA recombinase
MDETSLVPRARRAAIYVRMSTEMQQYSIQNQAEAIERYAAEHNLEITGRFEDSGRSGLRLSGRPGLADLLKEVQSGKAAFRDILVYDVSRWGRFQDIDESAYYEYLCKRAHVKVHYCAEPFCNDGSTTSTLLKAIKRSMAGEYSRELSAKVFAGQCRLIELGFRQGGRPGFGLRRQLMDSSGKAKCLLRQGEYKSLQSDRVVLVPGPQTEVSIVREIFTLFTAERQTETKIARILNARGVKTEQGAEWSPEYIKNLLRNPKYIGRNTYNRESSKLSDKATKNPPSKWIQRDHAFEPIVSVSQFELAQQIFASRRKKAISDDALLENLKALLTKTGKLTSTLIDNDRTIPSERLFRLRFKSLYHAYKLVGYDTPDKSRYYAVKHRIKQRHEDLCSSIRSALIAVGATVEEKAAKNLLLVNGQYTIRVVLSYCGRFRENPEWDVTLGRSPESDFDIVARMDLTNEGILDYFIFPIIDRPRRVYLHINNYCQFDVYRFDDLNCFLNLARRSLVNQS